MSGLRVYVASPLSTFHPESTYRVRINQIRSHFPTAILLAARDLFSDSGDWLRKWPALQHDIDVLVFFTDPSGYIGPGVYREVVDILALGKPVFYLTDQGDLIPSDQIEVEFAGADDLSPVKVARVFIHKG